MDDGPGHAPPRLSAEQLAVVFWQITDGVTVQAPSGDLLYANDAAARLIGFASAEALVNCPVVETLGRFEVFNEAGARLPADAYPGRRVLLGEPRADALLKFRTPPNGE